VLEPKLGAKCTLMPEQGLSLSGSPGSLFPAAESKADAAGEPRPPLTGDQTAWSRVFAYDLRPRRLHEGTFNSGDARRFDSFSDP
jgi:hypothetical protein